MVTLQVPDELAHPYEDLARAAGRDKADYMLEALSAYLEDLREDMEDRRVVSERLANPGRRIPLHEVEKNLGLED